MKLSRLSLVATLGATLVVGSVSAHELDKVSAQADKIEKSKDLPQTVVVRISKSNPADIQVAHVKDRLAPNSKPTNLAFEKMALDSEKVGIAFGANELDKSTSTSSWSFGVFRGPFGGRGAYYRGAFGGGGYYRGAYGGGGYYRRGYYPNYAYSNYGGYYAGGGNYGGGYNYDTSYYDPTGYAANNYYPDYPVTYPYYDNNNNYGCTCGGGCGCPQTYYPTYNYGGYQYPYAQVSGYQDPSYYYQVYCNQQPNLY